MKTPPFLISVAILLWGWRTQLLYPALVMAAVLESSRLIKNRWEFSESDIGRISDLCTIILVIGVLIALNKNASHFIILTIQWLPIVVFPLIAVQRYSRLGMIYGSALLILFRRKPTEETKRKFILDISYPYFSLCIVSAAGVNAGRDWFYGCILFLIAWALWPMRARKYSLHLWILLLIVTGSVGYAGQAGLYRLQTYLAEMTYDYFTRNDDPFKTTTAIGDVGVLKQSSRILFRIAPDDHMQLPLLLRQACYTAYDSSTWYATHSGFDEVLPETDKGVWSIDAVTDGAKSVRIVMYLSKGKNLLKLPGGAFRLNNLDVLRMEKNALGAVKTENEAGLSNFRTDYDPRQSYSRRPDDTDLKIPEAEAPVIQRMAKTLDLNSKRKEDVIAAIHSFFRQHFRYSLDLIGNESKETDLADFLLYSRAGHCEYFATATVLLLRAAGIPARYVSGYAAGEYSSLEDMIVVRQRHAHAWALAYLSGKWVNVDTTPPDWSSMETSNVSRLVFVSDFFSFLRFRFAMWRQRIEIEEITFYLILPLIVLMALFIKRLTGKKHIKRVSIEKRQKILPESHPGRTSEFYAIEIWLNKQGYERQPAETFQGWFKRLALCAPEIMMLQEIQSILALHYRYRFGPVELNPEDREKLTSGVKALLVHEMQNQNSG